MPVTSYISVGGRIISEVTDGVILDYVPHALGSIHSVIDQDANVLKTMRYKPYGEVLSRSGTVADRHYQWVGSYGYRATFAPSSSHYVRARHYSAATGSWSTVDPLWPDEKAYGYVGARSSAFVDPSGLQGPPWWWPVTPDPGLGKPKLGPPKPTPGLPPPFPQPVYPPPTLPPPRQQPPKGCMDYNFSIDFWWGFKYGNCCGGAQKCPPQKPREIPSGHGKPSKGGKPRVDCLDQACANHDKDIPDGESFGKPDPHLRLCVAVMQCDCASMYEFGTLNHANCVSAKNDLMNFGCGLGGILNGRS
jgi:RHS repeat-associated protein